MANSIDYIYKIVDKFSPALGRMRAGLDKFDAGISSAQTKLKGMGSRLQATGARLANLQTGLASLGAGAYLKKSFDDAVGFQKALNMTQAVTKSSTETMETMRVKALEWGAQTQFSSVQVADAMAELGKKGLQTNQILDLMPGLMSFAAAGEIEMSEAATYAMGIINQFGLEVKDAALVSDLLAQAASNSSTSVTGIAAAMNNTGLQAKMAGLSIQDTTLALMAMAQQNLQGEEAGTMMMNALKSLQVAPKKVIAGFQQMGINLDDFRDKTTGQMTDFWGLIQAMRDAGATGAQLGGMFDVRAMKAMSILIETNSADLSMMSGLLDQAGGAAGQMSDTLMKGPVGAVARFNSVMQNLNITVGGTVAQALLPLMERFSAWLGMMQTSHPMLLKMITYFLMGITVIGAILIPLGLIITSIGSVISVIGSLIGFLKAWTLAQTVLNAVMAVNPITWIILGVVALIAIIVLLVVKIKAVRDWFIWLGTSIADIFMKLYNSPFFTFGRIAIALYIQYFKMLWNIIKWVVVGIYKLGLAIGEALSGPIQYVIALGKSLWDMFMGLLDNPFFAGIALLFTPFLTIPALIIKHWEPIKALFNWLGEKLSWLGEKVAWFFGFGSEEGGKGGGKDAPMPVSDIPTVRTESEISVFTEKDMVTVPYKRGNNLGYNMTEVY
jgi:TP901 family phage tail tape measure protein